MDSRKEGPRRPNRIIWVGGSKGGLGKSMASIAALDYLFAQGAKVLLVKCDNANPDVFRRTRPSCRANEQTSMRQMGGFTC